MVLFLSRIFQRIFQKLVPKKKKKIIIIIIIIFFQLDMKDQLREWLNSITDENCYEEDLRFSTVQWLEALENPRSNSWNEGRKDRTNNIEMILASFAKTDQRYIVDELLSVIAGDFFDVFCVRNIMKIVQYLLKMALIHQRYMYRDLRHVKRQIQLVKKKWCHKSSFKVANNYCVEFERSQQIEQCCNACLHTIGGIAWVF
ncbi:hypothetical protein RFI_11940 [Reticulomyxa filosa]|uniref:Uncharacterized protein n=1 Tax=Reticulomyxa filosa TaxID=46433 RepID=X6NGS6_RETFI|nr:hypothetical protein RFI_11940 [Reticulomyxa filosa]|eukprot:ETO25196.1 hypothetical protein RFI_11940 [Reticulomyxa filosa]